MPMKQSNYTSIQDRIEHPDINCLMPVEESEKNSIPFNLKDYLELVDWGGREVSQA